MTVATFIPVAEPVLGQREQEYVNDAVCSGWVSSKGKYVPEFEEAIADVCGTRYAVAVSSGTAGLHLALLALGIQPQDEVIVPTFSFVATASTVRHVGATPVFADSDGGHWCIDPEQIERLITPRTKAIVPVHLFGHPADMKTVLALARKYHLRVIEDAAEALGALFNQRPVGGLADIGVFSFFGNKLITTGEGGMVVTNDVTLAERIRILRDHGMDPQRRYWHPELGYNYRLTNLQAALGVAQAQQIPAFLARKRHIAARYIEQLSAAPSIVFQESAAWATSSWWMFTVLIDDGFGMSRDALAERLLEHGVDSRPGFHPIHTMPPYQVSREFPVAARLSREALSLPSAVSLTDEQQDIVVGRILDLARRGQDQLVRTLARGPQR